MKHRKISQITKDGVCVVEFGTGLKARVTDNGAVEIKGASKITDLEFADIAAIRHNLKNY